MPAILTICADCERRALRTPKQGKAMAEALACLVAALSTRKRLQGLTVERSTCLQRCPLGRVCVTLRRGSQDVRHHLDSGEDPKVVAAKLAGTWKG